MMPTPVTRTSLVSKDGDAAAKPDAGVGTLSIRSLSGEGGAGGGAMAPPHTVSESTASTAQATTSSGGDVAKVARPCGSS